MTPDGPNFSGDSEAWERHLVEGNANQPRKRVSADIVIFDQTGRLLLVDPTYKPDWDMPGGMAEANEPPHQTARREVFEELGFESAVGELLCVDWVSPHGPWDDLLAFIFHGGALREEEVAGLSLRDHELNAFEFCDLHQARQRLRPYVWRRVSAALGALETGHTRYLQDGHQLA